MAAYPDGTGVHASSAPRHRFEPDLPDHRGVAQWQSRYKRLRDSYAAIHPCFQAVAQPGSAPARDAGGRRGGACQPDQWVASSNSRTPALQAGDPGANPGRSTSGPVVYRPGHLPLTQAKRVRFPPGSPFPGVAQRQSARATCGRLDVRVVPRGPGALWWNSRHTVPRRRRAATPVQVQILPARPACDRGETANALA